MKKIALFVALVVIFGGLFTFAYLKNSKNTSASNNRGIISKVCECEDPAKCKAEGKCNGECEIGEECGNVGCESVKTQVTQTAPYTPPCCLNKETK
jgi:hypothetical protein